MKQPRDVNANVKRIFDEAIKRSEEPPHRRNLRRIPTPGIEFARLTLATGPAPVMKQDDTIYIEAKNGRKYGPYRVGRQVHEFENGDVVCIVSRIHSYGSPGRHRVGETSDGITARFFRGGLPSLGKRR